MFEYLDLLESEKLSPLFILQQLTSLSVTRFSPIYTSLSFPAADPTVTKNLRAVSTVVVVGRLVALNDGAKYKQQQQTIETPGSYC